VKDFETRAAARPFSSVLGKKLLPEWDFMYYIVRLHKNAEAEE